MPAYRLPSAYARPPLRRRASGLALALGVNFVLLLVLMTLGIIPMPERQPSDATVVDMIPESHSAAKQQTKSMVKPHTVEKPLLKPPPIIILSKPTITPLPHGTPWIEMSKDEMASADISKLGSARGGPDGDSEEVGRGPHGEVLYAAEWARHPTNAELGGYLPRNAPDGFGLVACKTIPGDRVEDCIELDQTPGSHLASAVRQAAWQFRVRPPRRGGHVLVGSWVRILIEYEHTQAGIGDSGR